MYLIDENRKYIRFYVDKEVIIYYYKLRTDVLYVLNYKFFISGGLSNG